MGKNNVYLLKVWVPILILFIFVLIGFLSYFKNNLSLIFVPFVILGYLVITRVSVKNKISKALLSPSPNKLVETLALPLNRIPQKQMKESYIAYNRALSFVLYGEFKRAEEAMNTVDWEDKEPMFQALVLNIHSLINYFSNNIELGLSNSRQAKELSMISNFPGAKKAEETYQAYIEMGQILNGEYLNDDLVQSLELKHEKLPLIPKLFISWGLITAYKRRNQIDKLNTHLEFNKSNAPYCNQLIQAFE